MLKVFNTKTNNLEEFKPIEEGKVNIYYCGPTVYNYIHIGNTRPVILFDMIKNYLEYLGYEVHMVSNFTDVNDKILAKAKEQGKTEKEVSEFYIDAYLNDVRDLGGANVDERPQVVEYMNDIIQYVDTLIEKGYAYKSGGDVYFRTSLIDDYGSLSKQKIEDLVSGSRVEVNDAKENSLDFALWKKIGVDEEWDAPFGSGRPGWHTECVVMIDSIFGGKIDIHGGGADLKFPHHENEVAQAKACSGHDVANYWIHNGMLNINNEKMSKSLGNFKFAKDVLEKYSSNAVKLTMHSTHYRGPVNFSDELLVQSTKQVEKMNVTYKSAVVKASVLGFTGIDANLMNEVMSDFEEAMNNDFNTANAISEIYKVQKLLNNALRSKNEQMGTYLQAFKTMLNIIGINFVSINITEDDILVYNKWEEARKAKDFVLADELRTDLIKRGLL